MQRTNNRLLSKIMMQILVWCLVIVTFIVVVSKLPRTPTVRDYRETWENHHIDSYTMTLKRVGYGVFGANEIESNHPVTITVFDNQVVAVSPICQECSLEDYQHFTIEGLFVEAARCSCNILSYNPTYGYPETLGAMFIEGGWVEVIDFQPQSSE